MRLIFVDPVETDIKQAMGSNLAMSIESLSQSLLTRATDLHALLRAEREQRIRVEAQLRSTREELDRLRMRLGPGLTASSSGTLGPSISMGGGRSGLHRRVASTTSSLGSPSDEVFFDAEENMGVSVINDTGFSSSSDDEESEAVAVERAKQRATRPRTTTRDSEDRSSLEDDSDESLEDEIAEDEDEERRKSSGTNGDHGAQGNGDSIGGVYKGASVSGGASGSVVAGVSSDGSIIGIKSGTVGAAAVMNAAMQAVMEVHGIIGQTLAPGIPLFLRRVSLPCSSVGNEISLWSILKQNVGKDLSRIPMPVALNEPLSLVQRLAEELEYSELLDKAADTPDMAERLLLIVAFSVSAYASTVSRVRKPFTSLLGETYECIREDKGSSLFFFFFLSQTPLFF
jgi:hypothetical protein